MLDWFMCSDPWPLTLPKDAGTHDSIEGMLDEHSKALGFENWIVAFHEFIP